MHMNHTAELHTLANGLTILTKEIHNVPLVSQWVWYRVGSRNELRGKTGISHWVEHMQFKGTPKYPINKLNKAISRNGGFWNAMTHLDWTTYFETMPSHKIEIALDLEADRMRNSIFDVDEVEKERTVIISEREGNENEPMFRLGEAVREAGFQSHPYRHQVIGDLEDLRTMTRDDLFDHYQSYYAPENAVIAVAGDFDSDWLIGRLSELYDNISAGKREIHNPEPEPALPDARLVELEGPGDTIYLEINFRSPPAADDDFFDLMVLDSLLTGPSSLALYGGGSISNKTSRLYRNLVEKELAVSVSGGLQATIDPYLYNILTILPPDQQIQEIIDCVEREISAVINKPVNRQEIDRAIKQAKALFAYGSESITNQAFWMGYAALFADHTWFETYIDKIEAVTPRRIQATAEKYLDKNHRVIGVYHPRNTMVQNGG